MSYNKTNKSNSPTKSSPLEAPSYNKLKLDKKAVVKKLLYLFTYYSARSSRYSYNELPEKYFMEMFCDVWADAGKPIKQKYSPEWNDLRILYYSKGKKNSLDFSQFLDLLPGISVFLDSQSHCEDAVKGLMHHMITVYNKKVHKQLERHVIDFDDPINDETRDFIFKLVPDLTKVYKLYFPHEQKNHFPQKHYKQQSFESLMKLMKQFEVFPKLVNTRDLFFIFNQVLDAPTHDLLKQGEYNKQLLEERGQVFKLSKFIATLIAISRISLHRLKQIDNVEEWQDRQKEILKILLEYMQTVKSIKKSKSVYDKERFSFIVYEQYPQEKEMKSYTVHGKTFYEQSDKMKFYNMLDKIDF